jgi:hypothetical protein
MGSTALMRRLAHNLLQVTQLAMLSSRVAANWVTLAFYKAPKNLIRYFAFFGGIFIFTQQQFQT